MKVVLSEKGRALLQAIREAEAALAAVWREPFETYGPRERMEWTDRQSKAAKVYAALWRQM